MPGLRIELACFALLSACSSSCTIQRANRPSPPMMAPPMMAPRDSPASTIAPLELRRQLLLPSKVDPAAEAFLRARSGAPPKAFAAESPASLTAMAVFATGHAEARGLAADPTLYGVRLSEGERAELLLTPPPNCVTVVAHGGLGVMEIDSFVVDGPPDSLRVLAQDDRAGPAAVLGGQGACAPLPRDPASNPPRVVVIVRRGAGPVVMGVFRGDRPP